MTNIYKADLTKATKEKTYYALAMFPYPSGAWLHVGHGTNFTANDIIARFKRMQWYTVINPIGWDSFGLPTENYAMKLGKPASDVTAENIANYKKQCAMMDWSYDWDREVATSSPEYYKWTQWIFQQLFKAWLVYKKDAYVNRCPTDQTVLANDQVVDGCCERCGTEIIQKKHPQWFIKITDYAEKLINDLDLVDWPEETKSQQKYWIGKSEGAEIDFQISHPALDAGTIDSGSSPEWQANKITVFTTRPDTLFGVTALVLAPENASVDAYIPQEYSDAVVEYRKVTSKKTAVERQQDAETKSWVFSWCYAVHPLTGKQVPIWFADYVLPDYATGAVMFVPAHDERDFAFWFKNGDLKYNNPIIPVIKPSSIEAVEGKYYPLYAHTVTEWKTILEIQKEFLPKAYELILNWQYCYTWEWTLINSWEFDGMKNIDAKKAITEHLEKLWLGKKKITYKLRDWSVSRQRYWGSPIPVYYDEAGNPQLIPEDELPVVLPLDLGNYKPAGKSPLADHPTFPHYTAKDGQTYLRECDTLDTFMCSSFYYLRFVNPANTKELISKEFADKALPVDFYIWGKEHTYGHLLYARFIHKFLFDQGYVSCPEPFQRLFHQWMILGPDGRKMSKRWGNVITPEDLVGKYGEARGTDVLRTYTMFMGPLEVEKAWNDNAVDGTKRFLDRVERMQDFLTDDETGLSIESSAKESSWQTIQSISNETGLSIDTQLHKTIKGVTDDIEKLKFNTAVSKMMVFVNHIYEVKAITKDQFAIFLQLLAPFATKLAQEIRTKLSREGSIHLSQWPQFDENMIAEDTLSLPVQIGGKMRGTLDIKKWLSQDEVMALVHADERFAKYLEWATIKKIIYVQDKIVNVII